MTTPFYYSTTYTLDKSHFSETYDESITAKRSLVVYLKSFGLIFLGLAIVYYTDISPYAAWFIVVLGVVDALNIYFRKSWWLIRQMISAAANTELTLSIDEDGVSSKSIAVKNKITWQELTKIERTKQGWLLYHAAGKSYLSGRCLSKAANAFISTQAILKSQ